MTTLTTVRFKFSLSTTKPHWLRPLALNGGLEVAVTSFERGVKLQQHAQQQLDAARLRVEELLSDGELDELDLEDEDEG